MQRKYDLRLARVLREAAADAEKALARLPEGGAIVRDAQLRLAMTAIQTALRDLWRDVGDETAAGQAEARAVALSFNFDWDSVLLRLTTTAEERAAMKRGLISGSAFNVEAALERLYTSRIPLSEQVYRTSALATGWVERIVNSALARGANYTELAHDVRRHIRPDVSGGVSYAAMRLARTEINNAYHAVTVAHNEEKPWNVGMRWRLSGSHPTLDICDKMARTDHVGLGAGVYYRKDVPKKPHPQCLCVIVPQVLTPDDFLAQYNAGKFDDYIAMAYGV